MDHPDMLSQLIAAVEEGGAEGAGQLEAHVLPLHVVPHVVGPPAGVAALPALPELHPLAAPHLLDFGRHSPVQT